VSVQQKVLILGTLSLPNVFPALPERREREVMMKEGVSPADCILMEVPSSGIFGLAVNWSTALELR